MVIIFPTDTVYGIGTPIFDTKGIDKIYKIKKRSKDKPLACLFSNINQMEDICYLDSNAKKLINKYLPGPLTIIVKAKDKLIEKIGYKTLGIRIPNNKIAISILDKYGPMLTTSVNDSGKAPINEYELIKEKYTGLVDEIYDNNEESSDVSSTVISLIDGLKILREGQISLEEIKKTLGD